MRPNIKPLGWIILGAVVAGMMSWSAGFLQPLHLYPTRILLALDNVVSDTPQISGNKFRVVVCWVERDFSGEVSQALALAVDGARGLTSVRSARTLDAPTGPMGWPKSVQQANAIMDDWNADLAIGGLVKSSGNGLTLWFLLRSDNGTRDPDGHGSVFLDVPLDVTFGDTLEAQLTAKVLSSVAPLADSQMRGEVLRMGLQDVSQALLKLLHSGAIGSSEHHAALRTALGNVFLTLGERESDPTHVAEAINNYDEALRRLDRKKTPLPWARAQHNLGVALATIGVLRGKNAEGRDEFAGLLVKAIKAYRLALQERDQTNVLADWVKTQNNLANALSVLGEQENTSTRLEEAVAIYRKTLKATSRAVLPYEWATTQHNLGSALASLGARFSNPTLLNEAVAAYDSSLAVRTRESVPIHWAQTQFSRGTVLTILGELQDNSANLMQAVAAHRAALEVRTHESLPLDWARTQVGLGNALATLGETENEATHLMEAVSTYELALSKITRENEPIEWAQTQARLGNALSALGEHEDGTTRFEQASRAYHAAFEVLATSASDKVFADRVEMRIRRIREKLYEREMAPD